MAGRRKACSPRRPPGPSGALWAAVLRLEERSRLVQVLAGRADDPGYPISGSGLFRASSLAARWSAGQIRTLLESPGEAGMAPAPGDPLP